MSFVSTVVAEKTIQPNPCGSRPNHLVAVTPHASWLNMVARDRRVGCPMPRSSHRKYRAAETFWTAFLRKLARRGLRGQAGDLRCP
jgi:hypothetical protein